MSAAIKKVTLPKPMKKTRKERRKEKEVIALQERSTCILPATTFKRIVTQEAANHSSERLRFNGDAVQALQCAARAGTEPSSRGTSESVPGAQLEPRARNSPRE